MVVQVVHRRHWYTHPNGVATCPHGPGEGVPIAAFRDPAAAEARRGELEHASQQITTPWQFRREGAPNVEDWTTHAVARRFYDAGVPQPSTGLPEDGDWADWWLASAGEFAPEDAAAAWEVLGGGDFYDATEVERDGEGDGCFVVRGPLVWKDDLGSCAVHAQVRRGRDGTAFCRPIRAFAVREDAEAFVRANFDPALAGLNPFGPYAGLALLPRMSSLDGPRLHDWLLDCGFPTPPAEGAGFRAWYDWWATAAARRPLWQLARAWQAFDRVGVYEIVDVEWGG